MSSGNCPWYRIELPNYLTGELDEPATRAVERHVDRCESCRQELEAFRAVDRLLEIEQQSRRSIDAFQASFLERFEAERFEARAPAPEDLHPSAAKLGSLGKMIPFALAAGLSALLLSERFRGSGVEEVAVTHEEAVAVTHEEAVAATREEAVPEARTIPASERPARPVTVAGTHDEWDDSSEQPLATTVSADTHVADAEEIAAAANLGAPGVVEENDALLIETTVPLEGAGVRGGPSGSGLLPAS